jgi:hypothetical protein
MAYITKKSDKGGSKAKEEYIAKSNIFKKPEYIKKKEKKKEWITKNKEKKKDDWQLTTTLIDKAKEKIKEFDERAKNKNLKKKEYITKKKKEYPIIGKDY